MSSQFPVRNSLGWTGWAEEVPGRSQQTWHVQYNTSTEGEPGDDEAGEFVATLSDWVELPVCAYCGESAIDGTPVTDGCCPSCYLTPEHMWDLKAEAV